MNPNTNFQGQSVSFWEGADRGFWSKLVVPQLLFWNFHMKGDCITSGFSLITTVLYGPFVPMSLMHFQTHRARLIVDTRFSGSHIFQGFLESQQWCTWPRCIQATAWMWFRTTHVTSYAAKLSRHETRSISDAVATGRRWARLWGKTWQDGGAVVLDCLLLRFMIFRQ